MDNDDLQLPSDNFRPVTVVARSVGTTTISTRRLLPIWPPATALNRNPSGSSPKTALANTNEAY